MLVTVAASGLPFVPQAAHAAGVPTNDFVTRNGTQLMLGGKPFVFTGINIYNANSDGWCGAQMNTGSSLDDAVTALGPGKEVFRSWFFQPLAINKNTGQRDWSAFDHTLQVAGAHGMKVVATLTDQWGECGTNVAGNGYKTADWYVNGYKQIQPGMVNSYRDWVDEVVNRYKDDPRIAFWQLINEAEVNPAYPGGCPSGDLQPYQTLHDWAADVSGLVKSIDPNHLVSLGTIGSGQCSADGPRYKDVHAIPTIDLCEFHDYGSPTVGIPGDQYNGLQLRIDQCDALNKPMFIGEAGIIPGDVGGTLRTRAYAFQAKLDAQFDAGVQGFLAWAWSPQDPPISTLDNYDIGPGDPALDSLKGPQGPVLKTSSITMPPLPTAVGVDPSLGRIYCVTFDFYNGSNYLTSVDGSTGAILGSQATGAPGPIAVNSRTHTIYLVRRTEVYVPNPGYSIPLGAGSDAHGVAVDETTGSVYVAEYGTDSVAVIDTQAHTVAAEIPVGSHPTAVAVDPSRHLLYVTNFGTGEAQGDVTVIDTDTNGVVGSIAVGVGPWGVAVDEASGLAYVVNLNQRPIYVSVVDGISLTEVARIEVGDVAASIAVNPITQHVFVGGQGVVTVIDAGTQRVITLVSTPYSGAGWGIGVDPSTNRVYVSAPGAGMLDVIQDVSPNATLPSPPTGVHAVGGDGQAVVSWNPSSDGGSPITSYTATASPGGATVTTPDGTSTSATIDGLTNGVSYTFTATANNAIGTSGPSAPSNTVTPAGPPNPPMNAVAAAGAEKATVSWTPPASDGGSPITHYSVTSTPDDLTATVDGSITSASVTGLANGTSYTFTVTATNSVGTSDPSASSNAVTPQANAPDPVIVSETVSDQSGGTVTTGTDATSTEPLLTSVDVPAGTGGGSVTIAEGTVDQTAPSGYQFLSTQANIVSTATTSVSDPLRITFTLDHSALLDTSTNTYATAQTLQVFRTEGTGSPVAVPDCTADPSAIAAPDPCIPRSSRIDLASGDATFTVVTSSASAWNIGVLAPVGVSVTDKGYAPRTAQAQQGQRVAWSFSSTKPHSATDAIGLGPNKAALFDSGKKTSGTYAFRFSAAGTYPYRSSVSGDSTSTFAGSIAVPLRTSTGAGHVGTSFTLTWSSATLSGYVFDVRVRFKAAGSSKWGSWSTWKSGTTQTSGSYTPTKAGSYDFAARLRNATTGRASLWSPDTQVPVTT